MRALAIAVVLFAGFPIAIGVTLTAALGSTGSTAADAATALASVPPQWVSEAQAASQATGTPWPILLGVGYKESRFNVNVGTNAQGYEGPMQFSPATFAEVTANEPVPTGGADPWNPFDLTDALHAAGYYLNSLGVNTDPTGALDQYSGHTPGYPSDVEALAAGYVTTPGMVTTGLSGSLESGALMEAESQIGVPYAFGGTTQGVEFDCSGLVQWAYAAVGVSIPRVGQAQLDFGVGVEALAPGDLVFFGKMPYSDEHVGIFVGYTSPGVGEMIDAPHPGSAVRFDTFDATVGADWGGEAFLGGTDPVGR